MKTESLWSNLPRSSEDWRYNTLAFLLWNCAQFPDRNQHAREWMSPNQRTRSQGERLCLEWNHQNRHCALSYCVSNWWMGFKWLFRQCFRMLWLLLHLNKPQRPNWLLVWEMHLLKSLLTSNESPYRGSTMHPTTTLEQSRVVLVNLNWYESQ